MSTPTGPLALGGRATLTRAGLLAAGMTDAQVRGRVRRGDLSRVIPGVYRVAESVRDVARFDRQRLEHRARAVARAQRRTEAVIGAGSAAVVHGLPLVTGTPMLVCLLVSGDANRNPARGVALHAARCLAQDTVVLHESDGTLVAVTSVARTWVDIARLHPLADALSVGDAAVRWGLMEVDDAAEVLDRLGPVRGRRRALRALSLLEPRRESPLESASSARFIEWGFPEPRLQHDWFDDQGFIARSDFDWGDHEVVGFADGRGKYDLDSDRKRVELIQESRLRPQATVARWGWGDVGGSGLRLFRLLAPMLRFDRPFPPRPERW